MNIHESFDLSSITHLGIECYQKFLDGVRFSENTPDIWIDFKKFIYESIFGVFLIFLTMVIIMCTIYIKIFLDHNHFLLNLIKPLKMVLKLYF